MNVLGTVRPMEPADALSAMAIVSSVFTGTRHLARARELVTLALRGTTHEQRGVVAEDGGSIRGIAVAGDVAGTDGTARIQLIAVAGADDPRAIGHRLVTATLALLDGARLVVAELPDEPPYHETLALLRAHGFVDDGRFQDYVADGVSLIMLRWTLSDEATDRSGAQRARGDG